MRGILLPNLKIENQIPEVLRDCLGLQLGYGALTSVRVR